MKLFNLISTVLLLFGAVFFAANQIIKGNADTVKTEVSPISESISIFKLLENKRIRDNQEYVVYGYLPYWSLDKSEYIQYNRLTDIAYFGLYINADGTFQKYSDDGTTESGYLNWYENDEIENIINKSKENGVRFALTIISHADDISTNFLNCRKCWDNLIDNTYKELVRMDIADVNLNFEYVNYVENGTADKYTEFVEYFNREIDAKTGGSYVVVATFADSVVKPRITKINEISPISDGIFIMAYDFHRPSSDTAGPVSPIGGKGVHAEYDIETMIKDYSKNSDTKKLIMGVPYYGYNWVVASTNEYAARIPGNDYLGYSQSQTYSRIMDTILDLNSPVSWDLLGQVPYFTYISPETGANRQVYFENIKSLEIKYDLIKDNDFAGVGIWALGYDGGYQELWNLLGKEFMEL